MVNLSVILGLEPEIQLGGALLVIEAGEEKIHIGQYGHVLCTQFAWRLGRDYAHLRGHFPQTLSLYWLVIESV